jgi:DNA gyrase subunit A
MYGLKVHEIPDGSSAGKGRPVVNMIQIGQDEKVCAMLNVRTFDPEKFVVMVSRQGYIKKTSLQAFSNVRSNGIIALTLDAGDDVLGVDLSDGQSEIFMATAAGKSIRFKEADVRPMGRTARGVIGIRLAPADRVVEMEVLSGKPDILAVTANGYGKRTAVPEYRLQGRGGSGIINIRTTQRNGLVVGSTEIGGEDQVLMITSHGKIIRMDASDISRIGRATQGVRLIQLEDQDQVVAAIRTAEREEEGKSAPVATAPDPDDVAAPEDDPVDGEEGRTS